MENTDHKNPVDSYFREGLTDHRASVRPEFWERLAGELESKKRLPWGFGLKVAASLLLMAALGTWWVSRSGQVALPLGESNSGADVVQIAPVSEDVKNPQAQPSTPAVARTPVLSSAPPTGLKKRQRNREVSSESHASAGAEKASALRSEPVVALSNHGLPPVAEYSPEMRIKFVLPPADRLIDPLIEQTQPPLPYDEQLKAYAAASVKHWIRGEPLSELPKPKLPIQEFKKPVEDIFALGDDLGKWFNEPRVKPGQPQNKPQQ